MNKVEYEAHLQFVLNKIKEAKFLKDGFPHLYIVDIWETKLYSEIIEALPKLEQWNVFLKSRQRHNDRSREELLILDDSLDPKSMVTTHSDKLFDVSAELKTMQYLECVESRPIQMMRQILIDPRLKEAILLKFYEFQKDRVNLKSIHRCNRHIQLNRDMLRTGIATR